MGKEEKSKQARSDSEVRHALDSLAQGGGGSGGAPHGVTAAEIGSHPIQEDQPASREIHLFAPTNLDRAIFCRQLATMIEVGIPLLRALKLLSRRTPHPKLAKAIGDVAERVEAGHSFSQSLEENERIFSTLVCKIVRVGEVGGILEESLIRLAEIIETKADIRRKIISAMMYPCVALVIAFAVVVLILVKAVPVFATAYGSAENLPGPTQFILKLSHFVTGYGFIWLPLLIAAIVGIQVFLRTPAGRRCSSWISVKMWIIGRITKKIAVARFSRTLSGLLRAGVPLLEAMTITADTNENLIIGDALNKVQQNVEKGEKVGVHLARTRLFPALVVDMISIGEETGTLDVMLEKIADIYDADVDSTLRGLATIIEPLLIVFMGGIVIFIALATMLPYFNLAEQI